MSGVTQILAAIDRGEPQAAEKLLPLVYDELRRLAAAKLSQEKPGQTLQATALVHEAYLRLVGGGGDREQETGNRESLVPGSCPPAPASFNSRGHFFVAAAEAIRRILVEMARRKHRIRHGGDRQREPLEECEPAIAAPVDGLDVLALHEALDQFAAAAPRKAQLVTLRYFAGFTLPEVAEILGISQSTAEADWTYAKAWLKRELEKS
jgi:RNA polymerase sigma factor (sigma-70 family)